LTHGSSNPLAAQADDPGLAALQVRGCGDPEFYDPRSPGQPLPHRDEAPEPAHTRLEDPLAQHRPPLRDLGRPRPPPREPRDPASGQAAPAPSRVSAEVEQAQAHRLLEQEVAFYIFPGCAQASTKIDPRP
jgi:hypothetical protein